MANEVGGRTDKNGNRYEINCIIKAILDVADERISSCMFEGLGNDEVATDIDEVVVYGKIPRRSIAIPTTTGGMYSPDFMYVVKRKSGGKELNLIVETKDIENKKRFKRGRESTH